jgi:hypothetical protein
LYSTPKNWTAFSFLFARHSERSEESLFGLVFGCHPERSRFRDPVGIAMAQPRDLHFVSVFCLAEF